MRYNRQVTGEVAEALCRKHPNWTTYQLAKKLAKDNPKLFTGLDHASCTVRYYRGNKGKKHREIRKKLGPDIVQPNFKHETMRFDLPEPIDNLNEWKPTILEGTHLLLLSDIHIPFHDNAALDVALSDGYDNGCDTILLNGDTIDFYWSSRFEKDPRQRDFEKELSSALAFFKTLREAWPDANIYFKMGNHEDRYNSYLRRKAPDLLGIEHFDFEKVFQFAKYGIKMIKSRHYSKFGKLPIVHGHEFGSSTFSPVNPARGFWLRAHCSVIGGHHHRSSSHAENTMERREETAFSVGCLCNLSPEYLPINKWNHGFARVLLEDEEGTFQVLNKKIVKKRIYAV